MLNYRLIENTHHPYVECLPDGGHIEREADALDLVGACGEHRAHRLMLHAENLTGDFYNLKTGLAGKVLLKFSNYQIKTAFVLKPGAINDRFDEMAQEANRCNRELHFFEERAAAEAWLVAD